MDIQVNSVWKQIHIPKPDKLETTKTTNQKINKSP